MPPGPPLKGGAYKSQVTDGVLTMEASSVAQVAHGPTQWLLPQWLNLLLIQTHVMIGTVTSEKLKDAGRNFTARQKYKGKEIMP